MANEQAVNVFENTILLAVNVEGLGSSRKVSLDNVTVDADKDRLKLASKILQCEERAAISGLFANLRNAISDEKRGLALPTVYKRSVYVLPRKSVARVDQMLREHQETLRGLVENLAAVYDQRIAEDRQKLREKFSEKHYPAKTALQDTFQIKWRYMSLAPSSELQTISADLYQQEVERVTAEVRSMGEEVKATLREAAYQLVAHLHNRLGTDEETGKPKVFKGAAVRNLVAFLETFDTKNIMGDTELSAILNQLKDLLSGVEPKNIRTDEALRSALRGSLEAKLPTLATLVTVGGRHIELPDDDEPEASASGVAVDEYGPNPGDMEPDTTTVENCKKHRSEPKPCQKCKADSQRRAKKAVA